jgi:hypothetical protein
MSQDSRDQVQPRGRLGESTPSSKGGWGMRMVRPGHEHAPASSASDGRAVRLALKAVPDGSRAQAQVSERGRLGESTSSSKGGWSMRMVRPGHEHAPASSASDGRAVRLALKAAPKSGA